MKAIVAEDSEVARHVLVRIVEQCGHEVTAVADGEGAWDAFERLRPHRSSFWTGRCPSSTVWKGSAGSLAAHAVADAARTLEGMARGDDLVNAGAACNALAREVARLEQALAAIVKRPRSATSSRLTP